MSWLDQRDPVSVLLMGDSVLQAQTLRNRFFLLRHGRSLANEQRRIVSTPAMGLEQYGLAATGIQEVRSIVSSMRTELDSVFRIYASDFLRTRQTAEIASEILNVGVELDASLREREFGEFEGQTSDHYETVWEQDKRDRDHTMWNVESVASVEARMSGFVRRLEGKHSGMIFLLVSHGDPLQILIKAAQGGGYHRDQTPMKPADLRRLGCDD